MSLEERWGYVGDEVAANIMLVGLRPKFRSQPPLCLDPPPEAITNPGQARLLGEFLPEWLQKGVVREITEPTPLFFSRMFTVPKKNGKLRPILDLSRLNKLIITPQFKMESLEKIVRLIFQCMWGTSVDITNAYWHVPIPLDFQKFFAFRLGDRTFVFQVVPFGLTTAPWGFSRVMKPIKAALRRVGVMVSSFLDDFLILASSISLANLHTSWTVEVLQWLGFEVNFEKSSLVPLQRLEYLGVMWDLQSLSLSLPGEKIAKILDMCREGQAASWITRRELECLTGFLNFATKALPLGRLYLNPLIMWMNANTSAQSRDLPVPLDSSLKEALVPWLNRKFLEQSIPMVVPDPSCDLMTDASDHGWCGVLLPHGVRGEWSKEEKSLPIDWRELRAIHCALFFFKERIRANSVRVLSDNTTALSCLRHQGSNHSQDLYLLSRDIFEFCHSLSISLIPVHIKGVLNVLADQGSRKGPIVTEWSLDHHSFSLICQQLGFSPEVDLFATRFNSQLPLFVSPFPDALAIAWDAMSLDWNLFGSLYAFPPFGLLPLMVRKLQSFLGSGFVIAPCWPTAVWFSLLSLRCKRKFPLHQGYLLFQHTSEGLQVMEEAWNLWVWLL